MIESMLSDYQSVKGKDSMFLFNELKDDSSLIRRVSFTYNLRFILSCAEIEGEEK